MTTSPLSLIEYSIIDVYPIEVGSGWFYVLIGEPGNSNDNQKFVGGARRTMIDIWCQENAKFKFVIDENGILFQSEEDAVLFKMSSPSVVDHA